MGIVFFTIAVLPTMGTGDLKLFSAEATGLKVYAGPSEATAIGNIMLQAITAGQIKTKQEVTAIRQL